MMLDAEGSGNQQEDTNVDWRMNNRQASAMTVHSYSQYLTLVERNTTTDYHTEVRQRKIKVLDLIGSGFRQHMERISLPNTNQPTVKMKLIDSDVGTDRETRAETEET